MNATRASLAALAMAVATPAHAQRLSSGEVLAAMDANGDGALTRAEAEGARGRMFEQLDNNRDGALSQAERDGARSRVARNAAQAIAGGDADRDGFVSRAEAMARPYPMFDRLDRNRDNVLNGDELNAVRAFLPRS